MFYQPNWIRQLAIKGKEIKMKRITLGFFPALLSMMLFGSPAVANGLQILTEQDPPYSLSGTDGKPKGYGVEIVQEIQRRLGKREPISIYPWARAYETIVSNPGVVVFTMSRTKEREPLFQWVGPIIENGWVFIGKKSDKLKISSMEDARKLEAIGVVRDYAWDKYLTSQGFTNIDRVTEYASNVKKLNLGRVQTFVSSSLSYRDVIAEQGFNPDDYEILMQFNTVQMYIAHSKENDKAMVAAWQRAFDAMKKDGTVAKILAKWIPTAAMPGLARSADF